MRHLTFVSNPLHHSESRHEVAKGGTDSSHSAGIGSCSYLPLFSPNG